MQKITEICKQCEHRIDGKCAVTGYKIIEIELSNIFGCQKINTRNVITLNNKNMDNDLTCEVIESRIAICKTCPHHTYGDIKPGEITEYSKIESEIIRRIGNTINALGEEKLRCKKCGCFAAAKAGGGGRIVDKLTFGHYGNRCPDIGPDGLTNWERGHILNSTNQE